MAPNFGNVLGLCRGLSLAVVGLLCPEQSLPFATLGQGLPERGQLRQKNEVESL